MPIELVNRLKKYKNDNEHTDYSLSLELKEAGISIQPGTINNWWNGSFSPQSMARPLLEKFLNDKEAGVV